MRFSPAAVGARAANLHIASSVAGSKNPFDVGLAGTGAAAPTAATSPATNLTATSAVLNGLVNANGSVTATSFEYGASSSYGASVAGVPAQVSGSTDTGVSVTLNGLTPGATYHYRAKAVSSGGTVPGADAMFQSLSNNADLSSLTVSTGALVPGFLPGTTAYTTARVRNATAMASVTAAPVNASATLQSRVTGDSFAILIAGSPSTPFLLSTGSTTVEVLVSAHDGTQKSYSVSVPRNTLPVLSLPASPLFASAPDAGGKNVTFPASAVDAEDGALNAVTSPVSGSLFPLGDTIVNGSATDSDRDTTTGSFVIHVLAPAVVTSPHSVVLSGRVNPNGTQTSVYYEYGPTSDYGQSTPRTDLGAGSTSVPFSYEITGLAAGTPFYYRLAIETPNSTSYYPEQTFATSTAVPAMPWQGYPLLGFLLLVIAYHKLPQPQVSK